LIIRSWQGVDQYRSLVELGDRLRAVHIADNYGDMDSHVAPFQGTTNMDAVMHGLVDARYQRGSALLVDAHRYARACGAGGTWGLCWPGDIG